MKNIAKKILRLTVIMLLFQPLLSFGESAKEQAQIHLDRAWSLFEFQKYEEILKECDQAIKLDSQNAKAYFYKGLALLGINNSIECGTKYYTAKNLEQYENAITSFNKAIDLNYANIIDVYLKKGEALYNMGKTSEATTEFDKAIKIDDKLEAAFFGKGRALTKQIFRSMSFTLEQRHAKISMALEAFDRVIELNPKNFRAYASKAVIFSDLEKFDESLSLLDKAIQLEPSSSELHSRKAQIFMRLKQYNKAIDEYDKAIKLNKKSTMNYFDKWYVLKTIGKNKEALIEIQKAIELDPNIGPIEKYINDDKK